MFGLKNTRFGRDAMVFRQETGGMCGAQRNPRMIGLACGLVAGTRVATAMGWRPAEAIAEGDLVLTFDHGLQPVRHVTRGSNWDRADACPETLRPLRVPAGALGNQQELTLLPEQFVLVESDTADALFDDPFVLVAGAQLDGFRGIGRDCPKTRLEVIQLHFDADEIVFANLGALAFCPSARMLGIDMILSDGGEEPAVYRSLPADETAMLIDCLADEDAGAGVASIAPAPGYAAAFA